MADERPEVDGTGDSWWHSRARDLATPWRPDDTPQGYATAIGGGESPDPVDHVHWGPMDPRDGLEPLASGVGCAICGDTVPTDRIRILARRDDLMFVELTCGSCHSESLGIVIDGVAADGPVDEAPGHHPLPYGEFLATDDIRFRGARPISPDDLAAVSDLLARGDLETLLGRGDASGGQASR